MMRDLAVEQHSTQNGLVLNHPYKATQHQSQSSTREDAQHGLHCLCLVSEPTLYFSIMSACCNVRLHSPLKTVFNKLGDTYQAYCNIYKTHAMAIHHGDAGQPLYRDTAQYGY